MFTCHNYMVISITYYVEAIFTGISFLMPVDYKHQQDVSTCLDTMDNEVFASLGWAIKCIYTLKQHCCKIDCNCQ